MENATAFHRWKDVWDNRLKTQPNSAEKFDDQLSRLIAIDGFDGGFATYSKSDWKAMVGDFRQKFAIDENTRVLEVGCGSGAFLYQFLLISNCKIFGIDYSTALVDFASELISDGIFVLSEARKIPFPDGQFDVVFSHSVFQYFPNSDYAYEVIDEYFRTLRKGGKLGLLDLNDVKFETVYHDIRKKSYESEEAYLEKYRYYPHLFFAPD